MHVWNLECVGRPECGKRVVAVPGSPLSGMPCFSMREARWYHLRSDHSSEMSVSIKRSLNGKKRLEICEAG